MSDFIRFGCIVARRVPRRAASFTAALHGEGARGIGVDVEEVEGEEEEGRDDDEGGGEGLLHADVMVFVCVLLEF